uniref:Uncharacterized protein n=1 Tax=Cacopsylla melanoneura TaxID=428564 RepID=A0A8D8SWY2_9HEMI
MFTSTKSSSICTTASPCKVPPFTRIGIGLLVFELDELESEDDELLELSLSESIEDSVDLHRLRSVLFSVVSRSTSFFNQLFSHSRDLIFSPGTTSTSPTSALSPSSVPFFFLTKFSIRSSNVSTCRIRSFFDILPRVSSRRFLYVTEKSCII